MTNDQYQCNRTSVVGTKRKYIIPSLGEHSEPDYNDSNIQTITHPKDKDNTSLLGLGRDFACSHISDECGSDTGAVTFCGIARTSYSSFIKITYTHNTCQSAPWTPSQIYVTDSGSWMRIVNADVDNIRTVTQTLHESKTNQLKEVLQCVIYWK